MKKLSLLAIFIFYSLSSFAGPREAAWKLHNRLTGVPPKADVLDSMENLISSGKVEDAAKLAMQNPLFINVVLKNWVKPWSNRDQTPRVDFNDYVATVLGVIRDDLPFTNILTSDVLYTVNGATPAYSNADNLHYKNAETQQLDLKANLVKQTQSSVSGIPAAATSGVITTRTGGEAFFSAGTNRRVNRFTFINFLCRDYEAVHDITVPDFHVRQDVERNPGGDSRSYKNNCVGCHAGQDALGGAYAYYDFVNNKLNYTAGVVAPKILKIVSFVDGFKTVNDSWINIWASGHNANLGWRGVTEGNGASALNTMFSKSRAFSECMSKRVFQLVCMKDAVNTDDLNTVKANATYFESTTYNMKNLIAKTSAGCVANE